MMLERITTIIQLGGISFDVNYCIDWMTQRCNTVWVNERAITVHL